MIICTTTHIACCTTTWKMRCGTTYQLFIYDFLFVTDFLSLFCLLFSVNQNNYLFSAEAWKNEYLYMYVILFATDFGDNELSILIDHFLPCLDSINTAEASFEWTALKRAIYSR